MLAFRVCVFIITFLYAVLPHSARADTPPKSVLPFTALQGPARVETCTPKALGTHPHPALLAACFYVPFLGKAEVWEVKDKPNRLLARYATLEFKELLEKSYIRARQGQWGMVTFGIFFSDEGYLDLEILDSSFDAETGLAIVHTHNGGKPYSYKIMFVIENAMWRVDNILLFHKGCQIEVPIKTVIKDTFLWYRQLWNCGKR